MDETLLPMDFAKAGQIMDDELYQILVAKLPPGVRFYGFKDCLHSGTALDLRYQARISPDGRSAIDVKNPMRKRGLASSFGQTRTKADVLVLSGFLDGHAPESSNMPSGPIVTALHHCVTQTITCHKLLQQMRRFLRDNGF